MRVFEKAGEHNTDETLAIAVAEAARRGVPLVVASTRGATGRKALAAAAETEVRLIVVTHNTGFAEPGAQQLDPAVRGELEAAGATVHTGTLPLRGTGSAIRKRAGGSEEELVNSALRIFCQGAKVVVEMAAMVADAGLVRTDQDIIAVVGTGKGADTAAVVAPMPSNRLFDIKVRELLCKPGDY